MVVDVGPGGDDRLYRSHRLVAEIGGQDFDRRIRRRATQRLDHLDELRCTAVGQVVAIDRGDDDMLQAELGRRLGSMFGLERIDRARHSRLDVAKGAGPRADIAEDHYRGVLLGPAFANIGARRLFADGVEVEVAHQLARLRKTGAAGRFHANPVGLALAPFWTGRRREDGGGIVHVRADSDTPRASLPPGEILGELE